MRILFALPGLNRFERGAEIAFTSLASELVRDGDAITLIGAGAAQSESPYEFIQAHALRREFFERMPRLPALRNETAYEELSFIPGLLQHYRPGDYDLTVTCSFPFVHWALRRPTMRGKRPAHVFVTQNGDWPITSNAAEFRFFSCDGLVCTNMDYYENNRNHWPSAMIPNGVAVERFSPGPSDRSRFGLPLEGATVLMASALIESKRVADGIRAAASLPEVHMVCAGDGPERNSIDALANKLMPGRFTRLTVAAADMPALYRSVDAFMHLSLDEPFGNVLVEALACGLPIVGHDSRRTRWIVGENEFLSDSTNTTVLVQALKDALNRGKSGATRRQARAQLFAWPVVAKQYRSFFQEVVNRRLGASAHDTHHEAPKPSNNRTNLAADETAE